MNFLLKQSPMRNLTTLLLSILSLAAFAQGNNPYKGLGEEAEKLGSEILTLSQGRYNEFHDNDTIVRIGAALYNVYTQKIVGFVVEEGHSEATMKPEVVSMWLSVDPLARKFPELTPYNFVKGNPVMLIDPDGREPHIPGTDGKPISYEEVDGEIAWSPNTPQDLQTLGETIMQSETGKTQFDKAIASEDYISISVSERTIFQNSFDKKSPLKLGNTKWGGDILDFNPGGEPTFAANKFEITLFEGSIDALSERGFKNYDSNNLTQNQKLARTLGHELEHATNPIDINYLLNDKPFPYKEHQRAKDIGNTIGNEFGIINKNKR